MDILKEIDDLLEGAKELYWPAGHAYIDLMHRVSIIAIKKADECIVMMNEKRASIVIRDASGNEIDRCPWGLCNGKWGQLDGFYGLESMYDQKTMNFLHNEIIQTAENKGMEGDPTKIYAIFDDDGAVWHTIQIVEG